MKKMFPGYYLPSEEDFELLWREGVFVFDTNALLNMYDYPDQSREVFYDILKKMQNRIWIPFFVGIEFHRNKFNRISQSSKRVKDLLDKIQKTTCNLRDEVSRVELEKRAIGLNDIQDRLKAFADSHSKLSEAVKLAYDRLPLISLDDKIVDYISSLFEGKVGCPPAGQAELDKMVEDAEKRYERSIPPGYCDHKKDGSFWWGGIEYQQKHGDLIIWEEIIDYASKDEVKNVIFVTGDKKEDWWLTADGKVVGPHPSLVEEIQRRAGVERYWMYRPDGFLKYANKYLSGSGVTQDVISQVENVVSTSDLGISDEVAVDVVRVGGMHKTIDGCAASSFQGDLSGVVGGDLYKTVRRQVDFVEAVSAVADWIEVNYDVEETRLNSTFPDITVLVDSKRIGFSVNQVRRFTHGVLPVGAERVALKGFFEVNRGRLSSFVLVVVLSECQYNKFREAVDLSNALDIVKKFVAKYKIGAVIYGYILKGVFYELLTVK